jgi:hypothetical protein
VWVSVVHLRNLKYPWLWGFNIQIFKFHSLRTAEGEDDQLWLIWFYREEKYSIFNEISSKYFPKNTRRLPYLSRSLCPGVESSIAVINGNEARIAEWDSSTVYPLFSSSVPVHDKPFDNAKFVHWPILSIRHYSLRLVLLPHWAEPTSGSSSLSPAPGWADHSPPHWNRRR